MNKKNEFFENIVRNTLIILTFISIICSMFHFAYLFYQDNNIERINSFLLKYDFLLFIDNFLLYIFAIAYIILGIKSKKEVLLKISFSIFSILTTMCVLTLIVNIIAVSFGIFDVIVQ